MAGLAETSGILHGTGGGTSSPGLRPPSFHAVAGFLDPEGIPRMRVFLDKLKEGLQSGVTGNRDVRS